MIRMPHKHHRLSLAGISEARREEFDPSLASRCLVRQSGSTYPMEELLPPADFLLPFSLSSQLNHTHSTFSGK
jgi:hypothetical protein